MKTLILDPPNTISSIDKLWAYISRDDKGNEGLCAATIHGILTPLIAADQGRLAGITYVAEKLAANTGMKIFLVEFTGRIELREINGASS